MGFFLNEYQIVMKEQVIKNRYFVSKLSTEAIEKY